MAALETTERTLAFSFLLSTVDELINTPLLNHCVETDADSFANQIGLKETLEQGFAILLSWQVF